VTATDSRRGVAAAAAQLEQDEQFRHQAAATAAHKHTRAAEEDSHAATAGSRSGSGSIGGSTCGHGLGLQYMRGGQAKQQQDNTKICGSATVSSSLADSISSS
jgi:hypothetical protein